MEYTCSQRGRILSLVTFAGLLPPLCSTSYFPVIKHVTTALDTHVGMTNLSISSFLLTMAISPLIWGSVSDNCGRRMPLVLSSLIFFVGSVGCSISMTVEMLILLRVIQGIGASGAIVVGLGVVSDLYASEERGSALGLFYTGPLLGPILGPLAGGFINHFYGWQAIFWFMTLLSAISSTLIYLFLPETLAKSAQKPFPIKVTIHPLQIQRTEGKLNPFEPLKLLRHAKVTLPAIYSCVIVATFYAISVSQSTILRPFLLNSWQLGLAYIPFGISDMVGSVLGGFASDRSLQYAKLRFGSHGAVPESRILLLFLSIPITLVAVNSIGWLAQYNCHLVSIILAQSFASTSMAFSFSLLSSYVLDLFPHHASSIGAACNLLRSLSAGFSTSINATVIQLLGMGWSFTLLSLMQFVGIAIVTLLTTNHQFHKSQKLPDEEV